MIFIYIVGLEHISCKIFMNGQNKNYISPHIHQKCKDNYIEAFGAVYWAKNAVIKKILGGCNNPLRRTRVKDSNSSLNEGHTIHSVKSY